MSLSCPSCDREYDRREVEDSLEAVEAGLTPMFVAWKEAEDTPLTTGEATYVCSPECMADYMDENHPEVL